MVDGTCCTMDGVQCRKTCTCVAGCRIYPGRINAWGGVTGCRMDGIQSRMGGSSTQESGAPFPCCLLFFLSLQSGGGIFSRISFCWYSCAMWEDSCNERSSSQPASHPWWCRPASTTALYCRSTPLQKMYSCTSLIRSDMPLVEAPPPSSNVLLAIVSFGTCTHPTPGLAVGGGGDCGTGGAHPPSPCCVGALSDLACLRFGPSFRTPGLARRGPHCSNVTHLLVQVSPTLFLPLSPFPFPHPSWIAPRHTGRHPVDRTWRHGGVNLLNPQTGLPRLRETSFLPHAWGCPSSLPTREAIFFSLRTWCSSPTGNRSSLCHPRPPFPLLPRACPPRSHRAPLVHAASGASPCHQGGHLVLLGGSV